MWPDDSDAAGGVRSVEILVPGSADRRLTYRRLDGPLDPAAGSDPFVLGTLLSFMQWGVDVHVHGTVSARLLRGVEELQGIWTLWRPDLYHRVTFTADQVTPGFPSDGPAISAFSGGGGRRVHRDAPRNGPRGR